MEKILISRDEYKINEDLERIEKELIPAIQLIIDAYLTLEIGSFSDKVFKDVTSRTEPLYNTIEKYIGQQEKALKKAGIKGAVLDELTTKALEDLNPLKKAVERYFDLDRYVFPLIGYISFEDNKPIFSLENRENIIEKHSRYITTEEERELFEKHKAAIEGINALLEHLEKTTGLKTTISNYIKSFIICDEGNNRVCMPSMDYK